MAIVNSRCKTKKRAPKKIYPTERQERIKLVAWLRKHNIKFHGNFNEGKRSVAQANIAHLEGLSPGTPDLTIPVSKKGYHGLYIELKRQHGGVLSRVQREWIISLREEGYCAERANGFLEAKAIVCEYFSMYNDIQLCTQHD